MANVRQLIKREIQSSREYIVGQVLTQPEISLYTPLSTMWVCDVTIGDDLRRLEKVPIKALINGDRGYARAGQTVLLRKNTAGRYDIIGPADRVTGKVVKKTYTIDLPTETSSANLGFATRREPFEYYGINAAWNDGVTPFPLVTITDPDGNPI